MNDDEKETMREGLEATAQFEAAKKATWDLCASMTVAHKAWSALNNSPFRELVMPGRFMSHLLGDMLQSLRGAGRMINRFEKAMDETGAELMDRDGKTQDDVQKLMGDLTTPGKNGDCPKSLALDYLKARKSVADVIDAIQVSMQLWHDLGNDKTGETLQNLFAVQKGVMADFFVKLDILFGEYTRVMQEIESQMTTKLAADLDRLSKKANQSVADER